MALLLCVFLAACGGSGSSNGNSGTGTGTSAGSGGGTGPGGGNTGQSRPFVYVSETGQSSTDAAALSGLIEAFALDASTGALSRISGSPFSTDTSTAGDMAMAPHSEFAYLLAQTYPAGACCIGPTSLLAFALDPTSGAPTLKQTVATSASEVGKISVHPSGNFLYLSPYNNDSSNTGVGIFSVQSDNTVVFAASIQAQSDGAVAIAPNGAFLYTHSDGAPIGNWGNSPCGPIQSNLWAFSVNSTTGALSSVAGSPFVFQRQICEVGMAPNYITQQIDPSGQRLFVVDSFNATVTVFRINATTGALTLVPGTSTDRGVGGFYSSAVDPMGFLYIGTDIYSFTGFSLTSNTTSGTIPLLPGMPVQVTPAPSYDEASRTMAIDSTGSFLFSNENEFTGAFGCCGPDAMVEFRIDSTGALTQLPSTPITLAGAASKMVASPSQ